MKHFDILVAGEINPDLILSGDIEPSFGQVEKLIDTAALTIGSSSVIFACGAARLGLKVAFIGKCGNDAFGEFMLDEMLKRGIDIGSVIQVPEASTGVSVILNRGIDRTILTYPGLIPSLKAEELSDRLLRQARHLHVASYFLQRSLQPGLPHLFKRARSLGMTTSLDPNYDPSKRWSGFDELLAVTNVFLPNEAEACSLSGAESPDLAAKRLSGKVETLVIKMGEQGAMAVRNGQKVKAPSIPVDVVDTVGAGDSFDAGFIYAYLQGYSLEQSLRAAIVCGALSTRAAGGTATQAHLSEVVEKIDTYAC